MVQLICLCQTLMLADRETRVRQGEKFDVPEPYASDYINGGMAELAKKPGKITPPAKPEEPAAPVETPAVKEEPDKGPEEEKGPPEPAPDPVPEGRTRRDRTGGRSGRG